MADAIELGDWEVAGAAGLVLVAGAVSVALKLRLEKSLLLGLVRATVQLSLLGLVLRWVFAHGSLAVTFVAMGVMTVAASRAALARAGWKLDGAFFGAFATLVVTAGLMAMLGSAVFVGTDPWYDPRYALPLLGMLLGNGLTGISLCLDSLLAVVADDRDAIELELAMGATRWEASRAPMQRAVRRGIVPIVNAMMVVGIVSIPGMMTGQILAGADPMLAVRYQLLILFLIAASTSLGCVGVAVFTVRRVIDAQHRLRPDRVHKRK